MHHDAANGGSFRDINHRPERCDFERAASTRTISDFAVSNAEPRTAAYLVSARQLHLSAVAGMTPEIDV